jgi:CMP-N-acetylneuraminic acid synthetase
MKKVAIVPAKKGSVRCPGKNNALINGVSVAERAIKSLAESKFFDEIFVSTNDKAIIKIAKSYPVSLDLREDSLADSKTPIIAVVKDIIGKYSIPDDAVVFIVPVTNPLREFEDIKNGYKVFIGSDRSNSVVSVCEIDYPFELSWKMGRRGQLCSDHEITSTRKQDYKPRFKFNDGFVIDSAKNFLTPGRTNYGNEPVPFVMPAERSFYIDYPWQLEIIKLLIESRERHHHE